MAVGIDLPKHYLWKEWKTYLMLMIPIMIFMWLGSGLFIWALIPPLDYLNALVIAACVCPTDPILANSVVKGRFAEKHVPAHIRNALSAESGGNDGMGFPFLFLAIFLIGEPGTGHAIGKWVYETCLFQIVLSIVIGIAVGWVARKILQWSEKHRLIDKPSFLCFAIALALFLMSMTGFSGSDDVLACFVAGNAFSWDDWFRQETEEAHFQDVIDMMLNLGVFAYIGAIIPWHEFGNADIGLTPWRLVVIAILILLFRRLPIVIALKPVMPAIKTYREAVFSGWFGPMGVGAVFLSMIAKEEMEEVFKDQVEKPVVIELISPVVLFIVLASTLVHGTTIPLFQLGKRIRTRTLSITSTGSNNVVRLPKIRRNNHSQQPQEGDLGDNPLGLSETQRNTLINTIQREKAEKEGDVYANGNAPHYAVDIEDDDTAEEDFLPGDSDDERVTEAARNNELQSIRFLEPVKPRGTSQANLNAEKNEASVSSVRSWLHRQKEEQQQEQQQQQQQQQPDNTMQQQEQQQPVNDNSEVSGSSGLRNLFRRRQPHQQQQQQPAAGDDQPPSSSAPGSKIVPRSEKEAEQMGDMPGVPPEVAQRAEESYHRPINPRIEVWEENSHVVIEDSQSGEPHAVLNKTDPDWKRKTKEKIKELEDNIAQSSGR
ncbi:Sodium/hydrogen exchanger family-domain-containing protein [Zychaea mexicana]|uniref:Sodium/hydrogen exchanger family-domain-containing protein n=1 Tax=Zychaea mexicana TaxID=64656 RepID=UPI0022FDCB48|nr:Sodium/hydrogen exchanger family-domain-containing protein [Zychaea mexicana]KAI9487943.1 Sodium/hydrogen exchanger family-domain-containing protein [Zychaea mexicana]